MLGKVGLSILGAALLALLALAVLGMATPAGAETHYVDENVTVTQDTTYRDDTWVFNGTVTVQGASVTLDRAEIFLNHMPYEAASLSILENGTLVARNSTINTQSMWCYIQCLDGRMECYDTNFTTETQDYLYAVIEGVQGGIVLVNCHLANWLVSTTVDLRVERCHFEDFSNAVMAMYGDSPMGSSFRCVIKDSVFDNAQLYASAIMVAGPGGTNASVNVTVSNCTVRGCRMGINVVNFNQWGWAEVVGCRISGGRFGLTLDTCGGSVTTRDNHLSTETCLWVIPAGPYPPDVSNETCDTYETGVSVTGIVHHMVLANLTVLNSTYPVVADRADLVVRDSLLNCTEGLLASDGTILLVNCTHPYRGRAVGPSASITEYSSASVTSVAWADGPSITRGNTTLVGVNETVMGSFGNDQLGSIRLLHWYVNSSGSIFFEEVHGEMEVDGWPFSTGNVSVEEGVDLKLLYVDDFVPWVNATSPEDGTLLMGTLVHLRGRYREVGSGLDRVRVRCDRVPWTNATIGDDGRWNVTIQVPGDGTHTFEVAVTDLVGNGNRTWVLNVTTDDTLPFIKIISPAPWVNHELVSLEVLTEVGSAAYVNDEPVKVFPNGSFFKAITLAGGVENVRIRVVDLAGNENETIYSIELDQTAPIIAIDTPLDGSWLGTTRVLVSGLIEEHTTLHINEEEPERSGREFWLNLTASEGRFKIYARAYDRAGNTGERTLWVNIDVTKPCLSLVDPSEGQLHNVTSVNVTGTSHDDGPLRITVNGLTAEMSNGGWWRVIELGQGENAITVKATDEAGNSEWCNVTVRCDSMAPSMQAKLEVDGEEHMPGATLLVNRTDVSLVVTVDEAVRLVVKGLDQYDLGPGEATIPISLPADATTLLELLARDGAGNVAPGLNFTVTTDLTAPHLAVVKPATGSTVATDRVLLLGEADPDATLTLEGKPLHVAANGTFQVELELSEGENEFALLAVDAAGNERAVDLRLAYEPEEDDGGEGASAALYGAVAVLLTIAVVVTAVALPRRRG